MRAWVKQICKFCGRELEGILPECTCDGWEDAEALRQAQWEEEHKDDPPEEDFEKVYPLIYERRVELHAQDNPQVGDCIAVDARSYKDGIGVCIYLPFWDEDKKEWDSSGLCFDFPGEGVMALREMLEELQAAMAEFKQENEDE